MREFIRLQLKLKWGFNRNNSKASAIMTAVAALLAVLVVLALVWALTYVLNAAFIKEEIDVPAKRLAGLYLTIIMIGLTVAATSILRAARPALPMPVRQAERVSTAASVAADTAERRRRRTRRALSSAERAG